MPVPLYQAKSEFFRTLGHPARIRILELLSERDHAVHELIDAVGIEPSSMSQQLAVLRRADLAVLRRANLVVPRREAGQVVYSISIPEVRDLLLAARAILSGIIASQNELQSELLSVESLDNQDGTSWLGAPWESSAPASAQVPVS